MEREGKQFLGGCIMIIITLAIAMASIYWIRIIGKDCEVIRQIWKYFVIYNAFMVPLSTFIQKNENIGLLMNIFYLISGIAGFIILIIIGFQTTWYFPIVLLIAGISAGLFLESVTSIIIPESILFLLSFIAIPLTLILIFLKVC